MEGNLNETQNGRKEQNNRQKKRNEITAGALQLFYLALLFVAVGRK